MLIGKVVKLTGVTPDDRAPLLQWINDPALVRLHGPYRPIAATAHDAWFSAIGKDPGHVHLAIRPYDGDEIIGLLQLFNFHNVFRSVELTIRIGDQKHRGRGAGTEAISLAADYVFGDLNMERLYLHVFADNEPAIRAYTKAGLEVEGKLRRAAFVNGSWRDVLVMARLRS